MITVLAIIGAAVVTFIAICLITYGLARLDQWREHRRLRAKAIARLIETVPPEPDHAA